MKSAFIRLAAGSLFASIALSAPTPPAAAPSPPQPGSKPASPAEKAPEVDELPAGSFDLRPKFRMGQDRRVRLSLDSKETSPDLTADPAAKKPATDEMKTQQEFVLVFKPLKVQEDGANQVAIVFEEIHAHVEGPGIDDTFDSTKPAKPKPKTTKTPSDPLGGLGEMPTLEETLRPLVGEQLSITFDRGGNFTEVRGGEKFVRALNPMAPQELTQMGGDQKLRELFQSIVSTPGKPWAKPGESWTSATQLDLFPIGGSSLRTDYRLTSVQGSRGKIAFEGRLVPTKDASPGSGGLKLAKADYNGTTDWDQEDGFPRAMQSTSALDAELKVGDQSISLKQTQKMKLTRLPDAKGK